MRLIVIPGHADAELGNKRIREKAIVVYARAVRVLNTTPFKVALCWSAGYTEYGGLQYLGALKAESGAQAISIREVGVYFGINEIRIFVERQKSKIVIRALRVNWGRQPPYQLGRDWVNQGRRNHILATSPIGAGGSE